MLSNENDMISHERYNMLNDPWLCVCSHTRILPHLVEHIYLYILSIGVRFVLLLDCKVPRAQFASVFYCMWIWAHGIVQSKTFLYVHTHTQSRVFIWENPFVNRSDMREMKSLSPQWHYVGTYSEKQRRNGNWVFPRVVYVCVCTHAGKDNCASYKYIRTKKTYIC